MFRFEIGEEVNRLKIEAARRSLHGKRSVFSLQTIPPNSFLKIKKTQTITENPLSILRIIVRVYLGWKT